MEEKLIQYGVLQGSILGPFLSLIHVNDTDTNISNDTGIKLTLFADDMYPNYRYYFELIYN
jgi:Reverse transcriptase (RNA-dependent DNA polymerase).